MLVLVHITINDGHFKYYNSKKYIDTETLQVYIWFHQVQSKLYYTLKCISQAHHIYPLNRIILCAIINRNCDIYALFSK